VVLLADAHVLLCHPEAWQEDAVDGEQEMVLRSLSWRDLELAIARR
jgi:hypothetical protein